jgi:Rha family phage regulatory protein
VKKEGTMGKLILNPEFNLYERNGQAFCSSRQVADEFNKSHDDVLKSIRILIESLGELSESEWQTNFILVEYRNSRNQRQPEYMLTKKAFTLLAVGFSGKKALKFKIRYIDRFEKMEQFIKSLLATKMEFPDFTAAIMDAHEEPKNHHFSNEINMIYRIVLGFDAREFREQNGIEKGAVIKPYLTLNQIKSVEVLQRIDIGLIVAIPDFHERKRILAIQYNRRSVRAIA